MAETQRQRTERTIKTIKRVMKGKGKSEKSERRKEKGLHSQGSSAGKPLTKKRFLKMGREDFLFVLGKKDLKTAVRGLTDKRLAALDAYTEHYTGSASIGEFVHLLTQSVIVERFKKMAAPSLVNGQETLVQYDETSGRDAHAPLQN